jgi:acetoacetyl-CoA synthetase
VHERLTQIRPKLLFVSNGVVYAGVCRPLLPLLPKLLPSLEYKPEKVLVIEQVPSNLAPIPSTIQGDVEKWRDFVDSGGEGETTFERMGFNEPIWILFSSGTTGTSLSKRH